MEDKIKALAELIQAQRFAEYSRRYPEIVGASRSYSQTDRTKIPWLLVTVKPGKKYVKIDIGTSGFLMIDAAGNIFGIKAYGVIHRGHQYGTLDTTGEYDWSEYYPRHIAR